MTETTSWSPYTDEEDAARATVRSFLDRELEPNAEKFVGNLDYDREFWRKAGKAGILGGAIPEAYGGPGGSDLMTVIIAHELGRSVGGTVVGSSLSADAITHILMTAGSEEQKRRWAPGILAGEVLQCLTLTEATAGSDATAIQTTAVREAGSYLINGSKVFVSNGNKAHLVYVVAKTDPSVGGRGMSMLLVEATTPGISRRPMATMGCPAYDLAEFHFDDVRVDATSLLIGEGRAMEILVSLFALDRMEVAARALGEAELGFRLALDYVKQRRAFGRELVDFQSIQFKLAEMKTEVEVGRAFLCEGVRKHRSGSFGLGEGAMLKLWISEMSSRVIDSALQMFGGSGYMEEMPISRLYKANRLHRIYAGTSELQKVAIARQL